MNTDKTALVLGATGGVGGAIAAALLRHGWQVRAMARTPQAARGDGIEWVVGDAMDRAAVVRAAKGTSVIVHAVNPPKYRNWDTLVLPMIDNTIAAAREAGGARVVLPGTIYNFDPAKTPVVDGDTPQNAKSRKGKIRIEMEKRLQAAAPEVPALIVRAGDFFGPGARSSWFSQAMVAPGKPVSRIVNPGRGGGHSWAYLPDLAETFALLIESGDRLAAFERVQFEGLYDADGRTMISAIERVVGGNVREAKFPWWGVRGLALFGGFMREAAEIEPYWSHPLRYDNRRLVELIGAEPRTELDDAVRASLIDMGCLGEKSPAGLRAAVA